MRTLSATANRLLVVLAAAALVWTANLPWYAPSARDPTATDGPIERGAWQVARMFAKVDGARTGADALLVATAILLAALAAVLLFESLAPVGDALRVAGLVPVAFVLGAAVSRPAGFAIHHGLLIGFAAALVLASAAWQAGEVRPRPETVVRYR